MFENEAQLRKAAEEIVAQMLADGIAEKKFYTDERLGQEYWNLITPGAFEEKIVVVAVLGYPEIAGVWSFTRGACRRRDQDPDGSAVTR